jgi:hypothetical protein
MLSLICTKIALFRVQEVHLNFFMKIKEIKIKICEPGHLNTLI